MFVGCWNLMSMLCYQCIDYFLNAVDAFVLVAFMIDCILLLIKCLRSSSFFSYLWVQTFWRHFWNISHFFSIFCTHIFYHRIRKDTRTGFEKFEQLVLYLQLNINQKNSPEEGKPQLQINCNLLYCLWAILQLDQCIMSWHGPSFCADSSVTLGDPVKFISAVSPSQLAGFPSVLSPSPRWFLSPVATRETEFITNSICRLLIPYRGTCGSDKSLNTSNSSLGRLTP